jgi:multiple sugar transport system ATP-binding protein
MAQVVLERVSRVYPGGVRAVDGLELEVADGELLVLVGPSGCGKTTTLRLIAGLESASEGTIRVGGRVVNGVAPHARDVAMVFQNQALHPHLTVYGNMAFGPRLRCGSSWLRRLWWRMTKPTVAKQMAQERAGIAARVRETAATLGIEPVLHRYPNELSGGERQRVAVAKAILRRPALFLFDEPLSNLDAKLRIEMRRELKALHARLAATIVYVTHDQAEAMTLADRVAVLDRGRLQQLGRPEEIYSRPANRFVAGFMGTPAMNFCRGVLRRDNDSHATLTFDGEHFEVPVGPPIRSELLARLNRPIVMGLRPTDVCLRPPAGMERNAEMTSSADMAESRATNDNTAVEAMVAMIEPLGDATVVHLTCKPPGAQTHAIDSVLRQDQLHNLVCKAGPAVQVRVGQRVRIWLDMRRAHWFDAESGVNVCPRDVPSTLERPAA